MIAGGWIKGSGGEYAQYFAPNEISIMCTPQELDMLIEFFQYIKSATDECGECIKHFQNWSPNQTKEGLDIVIIVTPTGNG